MASTNPWDMTIKTDTPNITSGLINQTTTNTMPSVIPGTTSNAQGTFPTITPPPQQNTYGMTPSTKAVDPAKETVQGQFSSLTQSDNPIMTMARTQAKQQMGAKGLLNSSMALGAADAAAYQAALPIAQSDAQIYGANSDKNLAYQNDALKTNTATLNDAAKINLSAWVDTAKANMDGATKSALANIEASYKTLLQADASVSDMYAKTMQNITDINSNPDLDAASRATAIQTQLSMMETGFGMISKMNDLNLDTLLDFNYNSSTGATQ